MLHREPNKWKIFQIPPVEPIQYYSILKRKREFFKLIKQYDTQVYKHGFFHYCSIVPKSISSLNDECELRIVFLGDVPSTSFIGFRVKVSSEAFTSERNSLQLFLKQSKKVGLYFVNNNCIHVQCGKDAWEIFYHLYEAYLKKYVLTVIGTQFFNHFVYQLCLQNEKKLSHMLFRGSKIIRVSKMSIYYRIHQKRKISVTDLIHMTINMPESKRCVMSFDSLSHSNIVNQNVYTVGGNKIHISKLLIYKFKKQHNDSLPYNRFTQEFSFKNVRSPILNFHSKFVSSKFRTYNKGIEKKKFANSRVPKRKFEEAENKFLFPKCPKISDCLQRENDWDQYTSVKSYCIKSYSSLLSSESTIPHLFDNSKSSLSDFYCNSFSSSIHSRKSPPVFLVKNYPTVEETCAIYNLKRNSQLDSNSLNAASYTENKLINNFKKDAMNDSSESRPSTQINLSFSKSISVSKYFDQGKKATVNEDFTTAAGKTINISNNAMLAAHKFIQGIIQNEKLDKDAYCCPVENKQFIKVEKVSRNSKDDFKDDTFQSFDRDFHTATGKTISVSKAAMRAAQELMQDAIMPSSNTPQIEDNDANTLVEMSVLEDKNFNYVTQSSKVSELKNKNGLAARKIRKSLGGRRRFYSDA